MPEPTLARARFRRFLSSGFAALALLALVGCPGGEERACRLECPLAEMTVCGANGKDYLNACYAQCGGTTEKYPGPCRMTDAK